MNTSSHREKLISGLGGAVSILVVFWMTRHFENGMHVRILLVASMGATAVLLFAAPKAALSQPWNVIGGHMVSALTGIFIQRYIPDPVYGGALAVGVSITAMYYLRCLHPPGGASSLIPFISGSAINSYGFMFALFPVGAGAALMVVIAIAYNYPFKWRRYPLALADYGKPAGTPEPHVQPYPDITHADLVVALSEIDTFVDISEQDLLRIYEIACGRPHPELSKSETGRP